MATLTATEYAHLRNFMERWATANAVPLTWVKGAVNAAAQTVEDLLDGTVNIIRAEIATGDGTGLPAVVSARIDTATAPFSITFSAAVKKALVAKVFELKFIRDR